MTPCKHCGRPEEEHHAFDPDYKRPEGCQCEPREWLYPNDIPPVCNEYVEPISKFDGYCKTCEHGEKCHKRKE